jgi:hypothetical protein
MLSRASAQSRQLYPLSEIATSAGPGVLDTVPLAADCARDVVDLEEASRWVDVRTTRTAVPLLASSEMRAGNTSLIHHGMSPPPAPHRVSDRDTSTKCVGPVMRESIVWLRRSLGICTYLERTASLRPADRALVSFAIMWAPYGGSSAEDLMVTFGVRRAQFVGRVAQVLDPVAAEDEQVRRLKNALREELVAAWTAHGRARDRDSEPAGRIVSERCVGIPAV